VKNCGDSRVQRKLQSFERSFEGLRKLAAKFQGFEGTSKGSWAASRVQRNFYTSGESNFEMEEGEENFEKFMKDREKENKRILVNSSTQFDPFS
jgi:hypothetical protein